MNIKKSNHHHIARHFEGLKYDRTEITFRSNSDDNKEQFFSQSNLIKKWKFFQLKPGTYYKVSCKIQTLRRDNHKPSSMTSIQENRRSQIFITFKKQHRKQTNNENGQLRSSFTSKPNNVVWMCLTPLYSEQVSQSNQLLLAQL